MPWGAFGWLAAVNGGGALTNVHRMSRMHGFWRLLIATTILTALFGFGAARAAGSSPQTSQDLARPVGIVVAQATTEEEQRKAKQKAEQEKKKKAKEQAQEKKKQQDQQQSQQPQNNKRKQAGQQQKQQTQDNNKRKQPEQNQQTQTQPPKNQKNRKNQAEQQGAPVGSEQNQNQRGQSNVPAATPAPAVQNQQPKASKQPPTQAEKKKNQPTAGTKQKPAEQPAAQTEQKQNQPAAQTKPQPSSEQPAAVVKSRESAPIAPAGIAKPTAQQAKPIAPAAKGAGLAPQSAQGKTIRRVDELRNARRQTQEGNRTIIRELDRTIIRENGRTIIRHDEFDRFRYGARDVQVVRQGDATRTVIVRPNGDRIVTVYDNNGYLIRRARILPNGREIVLIDNRAPRGVNFRIGDFVVNLPPPVIRIPRDRYIVETERATPAVIYETLIAPPVDVIQHPYSLDEVRYSVSLRERMPRLDLDINFDTGSWELTPDLTGKLAAIADGIKRAIDRNPREMFLIEGHTDAVGSDVDNLSLSDRRAESVALALSQDFDVPPENLVTQGYGEQDLKVATQGPERANRRVSVRRITPLLVGSAR